MLKSDLIKQLLVIKKDFDVRIEDWTDQYAAPLSDFEVWIEEDESGEYIILG